MKVALTKRYIDSLRNAPTRDEVIYDSALIGFAVRRRKSGAMSWIVVYRAGRHRGAPNRQITLGAVGKLTPDQARRMARDILAKAAQGDDPAGERTARATAPTFADVVARFLEDHGAKLKPSTSREYGRLLEHAKKTLGAHKIADVGRTDVSRLHTAMKAAPYRANRLLAVLSSLSGWAVANGFAPEGFNPAAGVKRYREQGRERFLSPAELARLGDALVAMEPRFGPRAVGAIRLLVLTGMRKSEVLGLGWSMLDMERGTATLPDSKTGRKVVQLNAPALATLASLPRDEGRDEVFGRADLKRPWLTVLAHAGLEGVRLHDLRHSFASVGAGASLGLPVIGKLLGHARPATTARYAHLGDDPLRAASETIGATIDAAMRGKTGEIIPIGKRRG